MKALSVRLEASLGSLSHTGMPIIILDSHGQADSPSAFQMNKRRVQEKWQTQGWTPTFSYCDGLPQKG